jgi:hypothetical protein
MATKVYNLPMLNVDEEEKFLVMIELEELVDEILDVVLVYLELLDYRGIVVVRHYWRRLLLVTTTAHQQFPDRVGP